MVFIFRKCNQKWGLDILVFKTDFEGIVKWAKIIDGGKNETAFQNYWVDGRIHIVGKTASKGFGGDDILYFSMSADGTLTENDCFTSTDIPVQTGLIANAYDGLVSLKPLTITPPIIAKICSPTLQQFLEAQIVILFVKILV